MSALLAWLALRSRTQPAHNQRPRLALGENIRHMVVLGTTNGWLANVLTAIAVSRVDSAVVAMLQASVPLMVALLAHFLFVAEPSRARRFIGTIGTSCWHGRATAPGPPASPPASTGTSPGCRSPDIFPRRRSVLSAKNDT